MFVPPDANNEAGNLVDAAQAFLTTQNDMEEVAFVLVVDRRGQWRSVHARDGQQVPLDEEEGKFAEATASAQTHSDDPLWPALGRRAGSRRRAGGRGCARRGSG